MPNVFYVHLSRQAEIGKKLKITKPNRKKTFSSFSVFRNKGGSKRLKPWHGNGKGRMISSKYSKWKMKEKKIGIGNEGKTTNLLYKI